MSQIELLHQEKTLEKKITFEFYQEPVIIKFSFLLIYQLYKN
jgi:hypothetical protein